MHVESSYNRRSKAPGVACHSKLQLHRTPRSEFVFHTRLHEPGQERV